MIDACMRIEPSRTISDTRARFAGASLRRCLPSLACLVATALAGCTLGPAYQRPPVPVPQTWRTPAPDAADVANTSWWEAFGDPDLDALIKDAIDANKDLLQAALRVQQFEAVLQISRSAKYPQVDYTTSAAHQRYSTERPVLLPQRVNPIQNAFEVGTRVSWELDVWGRVRSANEAALAEFLASEEAQRGVMLTVVTDVATSYFQLLALDSQLDLAQKTLKSRNKTLELVQTRFSGGSATRLAVAEAQASVYDVSVVIPDIERQIAALENSLSVLVGRNPGPVRRHAIDTLPVVPIPQGVPSDVLTRRPDVREAEQELVSANAKIGVARAEYFPVISLTGLLGLGSNDLGNLLLHSATTGSVGGGLLGTIFSAGRGSGDVLQTEAVQKQMVVKYQQTVQNALKEVEDALDFHARAGEIAARGRLQVDSLRDVVRLAQMRYDGGQSSYLEVLDAERQLFSAEDHQVQRQRDIYLALISVYKAMGGGWMEAQESLRAAKAPSKAATMTPAAAVQAPAETAHGEKKQ